MPWHGREGRGFRDAPWKKGTKMTKHPNSKVGRVVSVSNHALHYNQECLREISKMLSNSALLRWEVHCNCAVYLEACRHEIDLLAVSQSRTWTGLREHKSCRNPAGVPFCCSKIGTN
jgi:hypothetical protein